MLQVLFIAKLNQTNTIILETLYSNFDARITLHEPKVFFPELKIPDKDIYGLIIFDLNTSTGFGNAPENINQVNNHFSETPLLVINPHEDKKFIQPLIDSGAKGVIPVAPSEDEITSAVKKVLQGETFISPL